MTRINAPQQMRLSCAIAATLASYTGCFMQVKAQPSKPAVSTMTTDRSSLEAAGKFVWPSPPPDQGAPTGRQKGGGSRGSCTTDKRFTALVPITANFVWGLTISAYPTFWFYVPDPLSPELPGKFVLQDKDDNVVYETTLKASGITPGVINIPIPSTAAPLEIGKRYQWTFTIYCNPKAPSNSVHVKGSVQREILNPDLISQVEAATPRERIALYAKNGIWHEALTTLAEFYRTHPADTQLAVDWENFLQSANLKEIAPEPIVSCCNPK